MLRCIYSNLLYFTNYTYPYVLEINYEPEFKHTYAP